MIERIAAIRSAASAASFTRVTRAPLRPTIALMLRTLRTTVGGAARVVWGASARAVPVRLMSEESFVTAKHVVHETECATACALAPFVPNRCCVGAVH